MSDALWTAYARLWGRAEGAGINVSYTGLMRGEGGTFFINDRIEIARPFYLGSPWDPSKERQPGHEPPDLGRELSVLAHEYGHFLSRKGDNWTDAYEKARDGFDVEVARRMPSWNERGIRVEPELPIDAPIEIDATLARLVLDEEERAWKLGKRELLHVGFDAWDAFESVRAAAFGSYEKGLAHALASEGSSK